MIRAFEATQIKFWKAAEANGMTSLIERDRASYLTQRDRCLLGVDHNQQRYN